MGRLPSYCIWSVLPHVRLVRPPYVRAARPLRPKERRLGSRLQQFQCSCCTRLRENSIENDEVSSPKGQVTNGILVNHHACWTGSIETPVLIIPIAIFLTFFWSSQYSLLPFWSYRSNCFDTYMRFLSWYYRFSIRCLLRGLHVHWKWTMW